MQGAWLCVVLVAISGLAAVYATPAIEPVLIEDGVASRLTTEQDDIKKMEVLFTAAYKDLASKMRYIYGEPYFKELGRDVGAFAKKWMSGWRTPGQGFFAPETFKQITAQTKKTIHPVLTELRKAVAALPLVSKEVMTATCADQKQKTLCGTMQVYNMNIVASKLGARRKRKPAKAATPAAVGSKVVPQIQASHKPVNVVGASKAVPMMVKLREVFQRGSSSSSSESLVEASARVAPTAREVAQMAAAAKQCYEGLVADSKGSDLDYYSLSAGGSIGVGQANSLWTYVVDKDQSELGYLREASAGVQVGSLASISFGTSKAWGYKGDEYESKGMFTETPQTTYSHTFNLDKVMPLIELSAGGLAFVHSGADSFETLRGDVSSCTGIYGAGGSVGFGLGISLPGGAGYAVSSELAATLLMDCKTFGMTYNELSGMSLDTLNEGRKHCMKGGFLALGVGAIMSWFSSLTD